MPSESRYAAISMRMVLNNNYLMPYFLPDVPFLGKPPLSFWASAIFFKIFGFSEFAGRLPHFLALVALCYFMYFAIKKIYDEKTSAIAILILISCALFYTLHTVMTESFLLLFMSMISLSFWLQLESKKSKNIYGYLFFISCALAMLTKGPVAIIMPCLSIIIYLFLSKRWREIFNKFPIISGVIIFMIIALPWFFLAEYYYPGFLHYFIIGENWDRFAKPSWSGDQYGTAHQVYFGKIWYFFAIGALPITIPLVFFFAKNPKYFFNDLIINCKKDQFFFFLCISFIAPLLILSFMRNMIPTYSIYSIMAFAILAARIISLKNWWRFALFLGYFTIIIYLLIIIIFVSKPVYLMQKINYQSYLIKAIPAAYINDPNSKLYYINMRKKDFYGYWIFKDRVADIDINDFVKIAKKNKSPIFIIAGEGDYQYLLESRKIKLQKVICYDEKNICLYTTLA